MAAAWWANKLCSPTFDNGDPDNPIVGIMAMMVSSSTPTPTTDQIQKMIQDLAPKIEERLIKVGGMNLGVDYGPDPILADSAAAAGISSNKFPWKTTMWVYPNYVVVSCGYAAASVLVWGSDRWLETRPACEKQKWDNSKARKDEKYYGDPLCCGLPRYHNGPCDYNTELALCDECGRPDGWYHNREERGHVPDFHIFRKESA